MFYFCRGRKIILSEEIPARHHDVVLLGLYSDYLQYAHSRTIDELRTCEVKVAYLNKINNTRLANLYEGQYNSLFKVSYWFYKINSKTAEPTIIKTKSK